MWLCLHDNGYNLSTDDISPEGMLQQLLKEDPIMVYQRNLAYTSTWVQMDVLRKV